MPKPPPTSPTTTRSLSVGQPKASLHSVSRTPLGIWLLMRSVTRPFSKLPSTLRGSSEVGARRWFTRSSATTCAAWAKAAVQASALPWRISAA